MYRNKDSINFNALQTPTTRTIMVAHNASIIQSNGFHTTHQYPTGNDERIREK